MINSCGTGKPTEAEADGGSGGSCSGCSAVRAVRAVRLFGCSAVRAVRLFGLFGRRRLSSPAWRLASGSEAPTAAGASSLSFSCSVVLRLLPVGNSGWKPSHRRRENPPMCWLCWWLCWSGSSGEGSPPPHGDWRAQRSPHRSRRQQQQEPAAYFFLVLLFLRLSPSATAAGSHPPHGQRRAAAKPPTAAGDSSSRSQQQQHPVRRIGKRSEAPPAESCSSAYLSLSFALSIISWST